LTEDRKPIELTEGRSAVSTAVRIEPEVARVRSGPRDLEVASISLGGVPRGAVVLLTGAGGLQHMELVDAMNGLAEHGYESVAAEVGPTPESEGDEVVLGHLRTLLDRLEGRDWSLDQVGVVGYGYGGYAALLAAASLTLGASISVDPVPTGTVRHRPVPSVRTPWLGMFGDSDGELGAGEVAAFGAAIAARSPVFTQVVSYPGVGRELVHDGMDALGHAAAYDSRQRVVEWFNARVVPRPTPLARAWAERRATRSRLSA
jgi:carboxymethylenebutenolidase